MPKSLKYRMFKNPTNKYNAKKTVVDGIRFDSQHEARYYQRLKIMKKMGEVDFFLRQVPIHLPGGVTIRVDFLVFYKNGIVRFEDAKGRPTPQYIDKKKIAEDLYPLTIYEV